MQENAEKLLFALYAEAGSKKPQLANINKQLGFEQQALGRAVNTLYAAGLISGVVIIFGDEDRSPERVDIDAILLNRRGVKYVEQAVNINTDSSLTEKLQKIIAKAQDRGWKEVQTVAAQALAEYKSNQQV